MTQHAGAPTWIDLATSDLAGAQTFYNRVFGWTFTAAGPEYGGYLTAAKDGKVVAGLMPNNPQWNAPDGWTTYLHTPDIEETLQKITAAGGQSCSGAMEIPAKGTMAIFNDATGALTGLWQPGGHGGFEATGTAGSPAWFQLTATDYQRALDFYTTVFGITTKVEADTPEFRYTNAIFGGEPGFGVMDGASFGTAADWAVFLAADDVDATCALITDNGGTILRAAEDTPYGRLAAVADPTGATFNLSSPQ
ncbi:hydroxylase [Mycobacterium sp. MS1601]|uniref:VOC family protein n=1 Tax=Mycobacterium sp. MS1601 TaxID=1936029 RepID=UPI0009791B48|nr:VOC family protein [Mycobacterium sp. MS1601]AQA02240.1 hydroxylase [Mycobacterium sp. MS1601]